MKQAGDLLEQKKQNIQPQQIPGYERQSPFGEEAI
jgi:hypothetical protein